MITEFRPTVKRISIKKDYLRAVFFYVPNLIVLRMLFQKISIRQADAFR
jgi:hypothetical protein